MIGEFSVIALATGVCICIIAYYLGMSLIEFIRSRKRNKKKTGKKK